MIKKELYFALTKHWILLIPLAIILVTNSLQPDIEKPKIALYGNFEAEIEKDLHETLDIEPVTSAEEGHRMAEKSAVDAFVLIKEGDIVVFRNDQSIKSYYVKPIIEKALNPSPIRIEYIGRETNKRDIYPLFTLFVFVAFGMPALLFQDDKHVITALLLSPVRPRTILLSKAAATEIILVLLVSFYLFYTDALHLNLFLLIVVIGLNYTACGTFFGIFYDNKYISSLLYPFMLLFIMVPLLPNPLSDWITEIMDSSFFSSGRALGAAGVLLIAGTGLLFLALVVFEMRINMKKVTG